MPLESMDRRFSVIVRARAGWACSRCGKTFPEDMRDLLHCSHFWGRVNKSVRFDLENCDSLCFTCHADFDAHPVCYRQWKIERLGEARVEALAARSRRVVKVDRAAILKQLKEWERSLGSSLSVLWEAA